MKNIIIVGASGMIGGLILKNCLFSSTVAQVTSLVRKKTNNKHSKLNEVVVNNFEDYAKQADLFQNIDVAFFCIGVYTGQVPDDKFKVITVDYAVAFAKALRTKSSNVNLCFLSGAGTDRTEKSNTSFARYKGMAENQISKMGLNFYAFRPAYIYPVTPRKEPNWVYRISRRLYPVIRFMGNNSSIKSTELAEAMFKTGINGAKKKVFENRDILELL